MANLEVSTSSPMSYVKPAIRGDLFAKLVQKWPANSSTELMSVCNGTEYPLSFSSVSYRSELNTEDDDVLGLYQE